MTTPRQWRQAEDAVRRQQASRGIVEVDHWGDWRRGDVCGIIGQSGVFVFMSVRVDADGNPKHVNVVGGPVWGQEQTKEWRAFDVDRLTKKVSKRGKKTAPAEALVEER